MEPWEIYQLAYILHLICRSREGGRFLSQASADSYQHAGSSFFELLLVFLSPEACDENLLGMTICGEIQRPTQDPLLSWGSSRRSRRI